MADLVREVLDRLGPQALPSELRRARTLDVIAVSGRGHGRKASLVVLAGGDPVLFLKTADDRGASDLVREAASLDRVAGWPAVARRVPRVLGLVEVSGRHVLVQTPLRGHPAALRLRTTARRRSTTSALLESARTWLEDLQRASRQSSRPLRTARAADRCRLALEQGGTPEQQRAATRLLQAAERYDGLEVPVTAAHGDLWPGNLVLGPDGIGVVDWEHFTDSGDPLADLFFLLLSTAHAVPVGVGRPLDAAAAFSRAFLAPGWYAELVLSTTRTHLRSLDLPAASAELLLLCTLLDEGERSADLRAHAPVGPAGGTAEQQVQHLLQAGGARLRHA